MVLRLNGDEDEIEFEEEEDDEEDVEVVKPKAKGANWSPKGYSPVNNMRGIERYRVACYYRLAPIVHLTGLRATTQ